QRAGVALTALVQPDFVDHVASAFFEETGTLGVRLTRPGRITLARREVTVQTRWGPLRFKLAGSGASFHAIPEYLEAKTLAAKAGVPLRLVLDEAKGQWGKLKKHNQ